MRKRTPKYIGPGICGCPGFFNYMKKLLIILIFIVTATAMADTFKAKAGESIFVGAEVPAGKIGGGDFYNLNLVPENGDYSSFSYVETDGGM
ncbi:MAG: hypothetical protein C0602_08410, partial [Denitrovibrio sp.]